MAMFHGDGVRLPMAMLFEVGAWVSDETIPLKAVSVNGVEEQEM